MEKEISDFQQVLSANAVNYGQMYFSDYLCQNFHLYGELRTQKPVCVHTGDRHHSKVWLNHFR